MLKNVKGGGNPLTARVSTLLSFVKPYPESNTTPCQCDTKPCRHDTKPCHAEPHTCHPELVSGSFAEGNYSVSCRPEQHVTLNLFQGLSLIKSLDRKETKSNSISTTMVNKKTLTTLGQNEQTTRHENSVMLNLFQYLRIFVSCKLKNDKNKILKRVQDDMGWFRCGLFGTLAPVTNFSPLTSHFSPNYLSQKFAFTLAEMMVVMLILSIVMAAFAPVMTTRSKVDLSSPWRYMANNSDIYYGTGSNQTAVIGANSKADTASRLEISTSSDTQRHILFKRGATVLGSLYMGPTSNVAGQNSIVIGNGGITAKGVVAIGNGANATGNNSVAIGYTAQATANSAISMGKTAQATADDAISMGNAAQATAKKTIAIGLNAKSTADDAESAIAIGYGTKSDFKSISIGDWTTAYGKNSIAIGNNAITSSSEQPDNAIGAIAIGTNTTETDTTCNTTDDTCGAAQGIGNYAISFGTGTVARSRSIAIGKSAKANQESAIAIGSGTSATANNAISIGTSTSAAASAVSIGNTAQATANNTVAIGSNAKSTAGNAVAIGNGATSTSSSSTAIGNGANANAYSTAIGHGVNAYAKYSMAMGTGSSANENSIAIGHDVEAKGVQSVAIGSGTVWAYAEGAIAIGRAVRSGLKCISIGDNAFAAWSEHSIAIGDNAITSSAFSPDVETGNSAIAIGHQATVTNDYDIAIGYSAQTDYYSYGNIAKGSSIAIGTSAIVSLGSNSIALGKSAYARGNDIIALGTSTDARGSNSIAIGNLAYAVGSNTVAIGYNVKASNNDEFVLGNSSNQVKIPGSLFVQGTQVTSDKRLKYVKSENHIGLDTIKKMKVYNYTFKDDKKQVPRIGVIAQDIQKILPDSVLKGSDGFLSVRIDDIIYILINAVKELDAKVTALTVAVKEHTNVLKQHTQTLQQLRKENKEIKAQNKELKARLDRLERQSK